MTGRQWPRTGLKWVLGPVDRGGLNLNETTIAEHLKGAGYATGIVGKWHLGSRRLYLPASRGFDSYLGIPYSDDMGDAISSECPATPSNDYHEVPQKPTRREQWREEYRHMGILKEDDPDGPDDPARYHLPLVHQENNKTTVLEQPLDFTVSKQNRPLLEVLAMFLKCISHTSSHTPLIP
jgi:arylsulfatase A-like enzyme